MKPKSDERGRFCSFNTVCGRNCTPREREKCQWWEHAKDEPEQKPLDLTPPFPISHAKASGRRYCVCGDPFPCVFPSPPQGVECDNCGGWLLPDVADDAGDEQIRRRFDGE